MTSSNINVAYVTTQRTEKQHAEYKRAGAYSRYVSARERLSAFTDKAESGALPFEEAKQRFLALSPTENNTQPTRLRRLLHESKRPKERPSCNFYTRRLYRDLYGNRFFLEEAAERARQAALSAGYTFVNPYSRLPVPIQFLARSLGLEEESLVKLHLVLGSRGKRNLDQLVARLLLGMNLPLRWSDQIELLEDLTLLLVSHPDSGPVPGPKLPDLLKELKLDLTKLELKQLELEELELGDLLKKLKRQTPLVEARQTAEAEKRAARIIQAQVKGSGSDSEPVTSPDKKRYFGSYLLVWQMVRVNVNSSGGTEEGAAAGAAAGEQEEELRRVEVVRPRATKRRVFPCKDHRNVIRWVLAPPVETKIRSASWISSQLMDEPILDEQGATVGWKKVLVPRTSRPLITITDEDGVSRQVLAPKKASQPKPVVDSQIQEQYRDESGTRKLRTIKRPKKTTRRVLEHRDELGVTHRVLEAKQKPGPKPKPASDSDKSASDAPAVAKAPRRNRKFLIWQQSGGGPGGVGPGSAPRKDDWTQVKRPKKTTRRVIEHTDKDGVVRRVLEAKKKSGPVSKPKEVTPPKPKKILPVDI